jgi:hypothetical protein
MPTALILSLASGRFVAFTRAANSTDDTNAASDIFVHDRQTGVTERQVD